MHGTQAGWTMHARARTAHRQEQQKVSPLHLSEDRVPRMCLQMRLHFAVLHDVAGVRTGAPRYAGSELLCPASDTQLGVVTTAFGELLMAIFKTIMASHGLLTESCQQEIILPRDLVSSRT
eukprot:TRINITY_DN115197_c0_g1_i1.p1 TRINITY_DN115197_c0_g1~~TRINITY_DN115197_c0_g1_i1.p1  ORF type:complete len:133 (+),score=9.63 TRINITY_DN115197_c0_g1_i1:38-400(+)